MTDETRPVHILTGFLGSGKTTLLNQLLKRSEYARTMVIVNEFGEISVDHHLIRNGEETVFELTNGCLCCSIRSELTETLLSLDTSRFDRVIIETTGIADPLPILQNLSQPDIRMKGYLPGAVIAVFPVENGLFFLGQHEEVRHQLALADTIYLNQFGEAGNREEVARVVGGTNPNAPIVSRPDEVKTDGGFRPLSGKVNHGLHDHESKYQSCVLQTQRALPLRDLVGFQHMLASHCGSSLLRLKGFAVVEGRSEAVLLQMSGQIVHEPELSQIWPQNQNLETRLVVIFKEGALDQVQQLFDSFVGNPRPDAADREALMNNPLAIPGT